MSDASHEFSNAEKYQIVFYPLMKWQLLSCLLASRGR